MIARTTMRRVIDLDAPQALLGGLSPQAFMRRHWQKKPLLVRQALPGGAPWASRPALFALAARDDVESRLVVRASADAWRVRHGPLPRRALPPLSQPGWTLLVQGVDLHVAAAHALLARFRFVPDARLDDVMLSWASPGGGVGPHVDSYDVFLLQLTGRRRWRVGRVAADAACVDGAPLRILRRFEPDSDWLLDAGDMLYLPPGWGHDGVADGDCITASVGFRSPTAATIAAEVLQRLADDAGGEALYRDPRQPATATPAAVPAALQDFARSAVETLLRDRDAVDRAVGEALSEPKAQVWFEAGAAWRSGQGLRVASRTRMLHDAKHLYVNGESFRIGGRDGALLRRLADARGLPARDCAGFGDAARDQLAGWVACGWLEGDDA